MLHLQNAIENMYKHEILFYYNVVTITCVACLQKLCYLLLLININLYVCMNLELQFFHHYYRVVIEAINHTKIYP